MYLHVNMLQAHLVYGEKRELEPTERYFWTWILHSLNENGMTTVYMGYSTFCMPNRGICISSDKNVPTKLNDPKFTIPIDVFRVSEEDRWRLWWFCWKSNDYSAIYNLKQLFSAEKLQAYMMQQMDGSDQIFDWSHWLARHSNLKPSQNESLNLPVYVDSYEGASLKTGICEQFVKDCQDIGHDGITCVGNDYVDLTLEFAGNAQDPSESPCLQLTFKDEVPNLLVRDRRINYSHQFYASGRTDHIVAPATYLLFEQDQFQEVPHAHLKIVKSHRKAT